MQTFAPNSTALDPLESSLWKLTVSPAKFQRKFLYESKKWQINLLKRIISQRKKFVERGKDNFGDKLFSLTKKLKTLLLKSG